MINPDRTPTPTGPASVWHPMHASFRRAVSVARLRAHAPRGASDWNVIIGAYLYNAELARGLHTVLNWAEISLRNHLWNCIRVERPMAPQSARGDTISWLQASPPVLLLPEQERVAAVAAAQIQAAKWRGDRRPQTEDLLIAELSFGFWTRLLDSSYANWRLPARQRLWPDLLSRVFPNCAGPQRSREFFYARFSEIRMIRNRVFHHERITHLADPALYDRIVEAVGWMNSDIESMLIADDRPRFIGLYEAGPRPWTDRVAGWQSETDNLNDRRP